LSFQDRIIDASKMDEFFRQYSQLVEEHQIPQISSSTWMKHSKLSGRLFESCFNQLIAFSSEITRGAGGTYHIALLCVINGLFHETVGYSSITNCADLTDPCITKIYIFWEFLRLDDWRNLQ
jgi:hypothetical protein